MKTIIFIVTVFLLNGCASYGRLGMIPNDDGNMYGSAIARNIVIDSSQFEVNTIKVTIRNTSGDKSLDLPQLKKEIENKLRKKGYSPVASGDNNYRIHYDVNVTYSGYIRKDMSTQLGLLGAASGGIGGYQSSISSGTAIGILSGATVGAVLGSYISDNTYITITDVTLAIKDYKTGKIRRNIIFDSSPSLQEERASGIAHYGEVITNKVAVYAGGRNVMQHEIIDEVKRRLARILSDLI